MKLTDLKIISSRAEKCFDYSLHEDGSMVDIHVLMPRTTRLGTVNETVKIYYDLCFELK